MLLWLGVSLPAAGAATLTAIQPDAFVSAVPATVLVDVASGSDGGLLRVDLNPVDVPCAATAAANAPLAEAVGSNTAVIGDWSEAGARVTPAAGAARWVGLCGYLVSLDESATLATITARWYVVAYAGQAPPPLPGADVTSRPPLTATGTPTDGDGAGAAPPSGGDGSPGVDGPRTRSACRFGRAPRSRRGVLRVRCRGVRGMVMVSSARGTRTVWLRVRLSRRGRARISARRLRLARTAAARVELHRDDELLGRTHVRLRR